MARPDLSYLKNLLLFLLGMPLGMSTGLSGAAASNFAIPATRSLLGLQITRAVGTGLAVTLFTALASLLSYSQHDFLRGRLAVALLVGLSVGKAMGQRIIPATKRRWLWGIPLAVLGLAMIAEALGYFTWPRGYRLVNTLGVHDLRFVLIAILLAFGIGIISQIIGLGSELIVPAQIYLLGLTPHVAIGTALVVLALASLPGLLVLARHGQIDLQSAAWLSFGGIFGGLIGAFWAVHLPDQILLALFGALLTLLGIRLLWVREDSAPAPINRAED